MAQEAHPKPQTRRKLVIRRANAGDSEVIAALGKRVYAPHPSMNARMIKGQINNFPEGQFVAEFDGRVVGHCATFIISGEVALKRHTWSEITANGFASRHNPDGDYLYGMEVIVDPEFRRLRIGQRLYKARQNLCQEWGLKGIVFGGRMPGYRRRKKQYAVPMSYIEAVQAREIRDVTINFHLSNGFEPIGVLKNYDRDDAQSCGYATHMLWRNPQLPEEPANAKSKDELSPQQMVRVATVQFQMRGLTSQEEFRKQVEYFVDVASDYRCDFVVFPENFTLQLLSLEPKPMQPKEGVEKITAYTDWFCEFMSGFAVSYNINIIGGTHPIIDGDGEIKNVCYVFLRDGSVHAREKIHPTPSEAYWWNIKGGGEADVINTDCGPVGVMICYDSEFPELARHLVDQGAMILFVPFCTDERRGFLRVRYCSQARAIENQCYVVLSGIVGNLPNVENMDIHYAESCILTPCDFAFARDGIAADTAPNTETIAFADLNLSDLRVSRSAGTVKNLQDRRFDLYRVVWRDG
ncbi:MAG: bifunctional GNAT family N-acetyltransferase/carbon-nitrogen hydrolase family protein [Alphaproteobacteria bacterium]|nr:bifunctional GNAT family N-acetyltransferase/carbon-nitrogen hydrolase family protein [Alphaproteobacteria bacterium]